MITQFAYNNTTTNFSVCAYGDGIIVYQWYRDSNIIPGAISARYSILSTTSDVDNSVFYCVASSQYGVSAQSTSIQLIFKYPALSIVSQPLSLTTYTNLPAVFTLSAEGDGVLTYQWRRSDTGSIPGATSFRYLLPRVRSADNNIDFTCIVRSNLGPSLTSSSARLSAVNADLVFIKDPVDIYVDEGDTASFFASAVGNGNITYRWLRFDSGLIPNQNLPTYEITDVQFADNSANFVCVASSSLGLHIVSNFVTLYVKKKIIKFVIQPTSTFAYTGQTATFSVSAVGSGSLSETIIYQWRRSDIGIISGATNTDYSLSNVSLSDNSVSFFCVASSNLAGPISSNSALLSSRNPILSFTTQPASAFAFASNIISFAVNTVADGIVSYQWRRSDTGTIVGATSSRYNIVASVSDNNINFYCVASSTFGLTLTSNNALLSSRNPQILILTQPVSTSNFLTLSSKFSLSAIADGSITYEWYRSDIGAIPNTNENYYDLTNISLSDNSIEFYCVLYSSLFATATSNRAALSAIIPRLSFVVQPSSARVFEGQTATFTASAVGDGTITYEWKRFNSLTTIATTNSLSVIDASTGDNNTRYICYASSNLNVTITSNYATLNVTNVGETTPDEEAAIHNLTGLGNGSRGEDGVLYVDGQRATESEIAANDAAATADLTGEGDGTTGIDGKFYTNGELSSPAQAAAQSSNFSGLGNGTIGESGIWYTNGDFSTPAQAASQAFFTGKGDGMIGDNNVWYTDGMPSTPAQAAYQANLTGKGDGTIGDSDTYYTAGVPSTPTQAAQQDNFTGLGNGSIGVSGTWYTNGSPSIPPIAARQAALTGLGNGAIGESGIWYTNGIPSGALEYAQQTNYTGPITAFQPFNHPIIDGIYYSGVNVSDYTVINYSTENLLGTSDFYVEFWSYPIARLANVPLIFRNTILTNNILAMTLGHASYTTEPYIMVYINSEQPTFQSSKKLNYNEWSHIAISRNGNVFTLFINGEIAGTHTSSVDLTPLPQYRDWYTGIAGQLGSSTYGYNGYIANFKIVKGSSITDVKFNTPQVGLTPTVKSSILIAGDIV
jgi:hypothetical protein